MHPAPISVHTELSGLPVCPSAPDTSSSIPNAISRLQSLSSSSAAALLSQDRWPQKSVLRKTKAQRQGSSPRDPTPAFGFLPPQWSVTWRAAPWGSRVRARTTMEPRGVSTEGSPTIASPAGCCPVRLCAQLRRLPLLGWGGALCPIVPARSGNCQGCRVSGWLRVQQPASAVTSIPPSSDLRALASLSLLTRSHSRARTSTTSCPHLVCQLCPDQHRPSDC